MAIKKVFQVEVDTGQAPKSIGEVRQAIKDLNKEIAGVEFGTAKYRELAQKLGDAKNEFKDFKDEVNQFDSGARAQAFATLGQTIAGGFAIATGAAAVFGASQEDVQKQLVKVQGAIAILQGVQSVADAAKQAGVVKNIILTDLQTAAESKNVVVRKAAAAAQWLLNLAMSANPIFLVITAVIALIAAYKLIKSASEEVKASEEDLNEAYKVRAELTKKNSELTTKLILDDRAREKQALKDSINDTIRTEAQRILILKQKGVDVKFLEDEARQFKLKSQELLRRGLLEIDEKFNKQEADEAKKISDEEKAKRQKAADEAKKAAEERFSREQANAERRIKLTKEGEAQQLALFDLETKNLRKAAKERKEDLELFDKLRLKERAKVERDAAVERIKAQDDAEQLQFDATRFNEEQAAAFRAEQREIDLQNTKDIAAAKLATEESLFNALTSIGDLFAKEGARQSDFQKGVALAQIAADTARAISSLVAFSQANPLNAVTFGSAGAAQYAAGLAQILGNIAAAKRILFSGGTASATPSAATPSAPSGLTTRASDIQRQRFDAGGQNSTINFDPTQIKVAVVERDITDTIARVNVIERRATVR